MMNQSINPETLTKSIEIMQKSDLVIICGTSFVVYPFAQLLAYSNEKAKIIAINKTEIPTPGIKQIIGDAIDVFKFLN
ncbi:NAD-dependent protein deacetylase [Lactobacillus helveticus]|nr:NAD-dependent protein deacetylase [Lactobacillus helveticus]NRO45921.1 NAD-dependent protein deacetylase [Lactobacillus helveticus]NRO59631.1 NAD-dependent protein deacetylase [Lactobacillus helveticus]NRO72939.1 NAD-dependent protein deacetylase [Lactobacillus helveticus]